MGARVSRTWLHALLILAFAGPAGAREAFVHAGHAVHPACVHALTMHQGDALPVTTAVSLEGCAASQRSRSEPRYEGDVLVFEDEALLGDGSFGYRELTRLENGIYGLVIHRGLPGGDERVSLAAIEMTKRPMIRHGEIVYMQQIELLGELWIPGMDSLSFRSMGNVVHFVAGTGPERVERTVDFTRLGKLRR